MNDLLWQVPLWAIIAFVVVRILLAPYWLAKEDAETVASLSSNTTLPKPFVKALDESQVGKDALRESLVTVAMVIEQHRRLLEVALSNSDRWGTGARASEVGIIAESTIRMAQTYLPQLPATPRNPLILPTKEWNRYSYTFDVPRRVPPSVQFDNLKEGVSASVKSASVIGFEVSFFHEPSGNQRRVEPQPYTANSRMSDGRGDV